VQTLKSISRKSVSVCVTATFITLRSIVLVEILGIQKLTNAFGLTVLFQGIAVLLGSPVSGFCLSVNCFYRLLSADAFYATSSCHSLNLPISAFLCSSYSDSISELNSTV